MSTNDVPGAVKANNDELAMGCWAEHDDGSLILVENTEGNRVIFCIFDLAANPPVQYRSAMKENEFKRQFTWDPQAKTVKSLKWTWHDKTQFPWDRIIQTFDEGPHPLSAEHQLTAAEQVAQSLHLRAEAIEQRPGWQRPAASILDRIKTAVGALRP